MEFHCSALPPRNPAAMQRLVRLADELGFDRFWVTDQTFHGDPFVMLLEAARASNISLGLALTNPFTRHPAQIARAIATLRHMAPRSDWAFTLGASNPRHVMAPLGMSMRNSATQISTAVDVIRRLLGGERVTCIDERLDFQLRDVALEIDPVDDVDLLIGTRGPRTLYEAGKVADAVIVEALFQPEVIEWAAEQIADGRDEAGKVGKVPYIAWQITEVLDAGDALPRHAADFATMLMSTTDARVLKRLGFPEDLVAELKSDTPPTAVPDWAVQRFAAFDSAENLRQRVDAARAAGVDAWSCSFTGDEQNTAGSMRRFATEVMEPLRTA